MQLRAIRTISVLSFLILFLFTSCENKLEDAKKITTHSNANIEKGTGVEILYTDMGKIRIKAVAATTRRYSTDKPYLEFSDGLKLFFYNDKMEVESMLSANYATAVENSHQMTARKNVEVINEKGEKLNTEELIWDEDKKMIYSNTFVKITTADEIIYGNGMTANENFTDYTIKKITGNIKVKPENDPTAESTTRK